MNLTLPVSGAWRRTAIDLGQWLPGGSADGRNRRISLVAPSPREGPLTEPIPGAQPRPRERFLMPLSSHFVDATLIRTEAMGSGPSV